MQVAPHYLKAPIKEAVLDIRATLPNTATLKVLEDMFRDLRKEYPARGPRMFVEGELVSGERISATASQRQTGFSFKSQNEQQIIQADLSGFSFSRLEPYDRWETFRDESRRLWSIYRQRTNPLSIDRLAVRYINELAIPQSFLDFADYLQVFPQLPKELDTGLASYFMQLLLPQEDIKAVLALHQAYPPRTEPDVVRIILDIDIFRSMDVPDDEEEIWDFFELLRKRKNKVFDACLTKHMKELIS